MKYLLLLLLKAWVSVMGFLILFLIIYRMAEFFKMLIFIQTSFISFRKLNKRDKQELLYIRLNSAQVRNEEKCKFVLANLQRIAQGRAISSYDLLDDLSSLKYKIQVIVDNDLKIERWKKMFLT